MKLKIEYVDINSIKPYENNAKEHPQEQIEQIKKSIEEFGMNDPIGIWHDEIVEGHGRLIACKELGYKEVPIIRLDELTDSKRKAYALVHNQLTMNSGFDIEILDNELDDLINDDDFDIDMTEFGFDIDEGQEEVEVVEDEVPEVPEEPKSKLGDIYQLGNHRLMCGDSTSKEDVTQLMDGVKADMVFTDPPYGYEYQSNMRTKTEKFDVIENDDKKLDFMPIIKKFNNGFVFVCTTWKVLKEWLEIFTKYYTLSNMIIWNKGGGGIGDLRHTFSTDYEIILCSNNGKELGACGV